MKKHSSFIVLLILTFTSIFAYTGKAEAACRNPNIVKNDAPGFIPAAASGFVEIKWFGHSFFQITSSRGTTLITDPFGPMGLPMPEVWPHVITVGREHGNHNNVGLAKGSPIVLRALNEENLGWNVINLTYRDVFIYNVPVHTRGWAGYLESMKGAAFVFEVDGICILHSGDVSEPFNEDQLQFIGHIDVLLVPIGGTWAAGPEEAKKIVEQLKPKIVVPMHYWLQRSTLELFIDAPYQVRFLKTNKFKVSKDTLPSSTEIYVLEIMEEEPL